MRRNRRLFVFAMMVGVSTSTLSFVAGAGAQTSGGPSVSVPPTIPSSTPTVTPPPPVQDLVTVTPDCIGPGRARYGIEVRSEHNGPVSGTVRSSATGEVLNTYQITEAGGTTRTNAPVYEKQLTFITTSADGLTDVDRVETQACETTTPTTTQPLNLAERLQALMETAEFQSNVPAEVRSIIIALIGQVSSLLI